MLDDDIDRDGIPDLILASMLAAFAYCPRLCYLQFVQGEFQDSAELAEGRFQHRWIGAGQNEVPEDPEVSQASLDSLTLLEKKAEGASRMESLRMMPVQWSLSQQFEAAEILELQTQRNGARMRR